MFLSLGLAASLGVAATTRFQQRFPNAFRRFPDLSDWIMSHQADLATIQLGNVRRRSFILRERRTR
jgi:hypothetical protein